MRTLRRIAFAVAVSALVAAASWWYLDRDDSVSRLVRAAPRDFRVVEARITGGFAWAPLNRATRAAKANPEISEMRLIGAASDVIALTRGSSSLDARHTEARALLLNRSARQAATTLASLAATSGDAMVWSDLAAAEYEIAIRENTPSRLANALVAADTALSIAPALPEALFNRALVIERLGIRDQAREAWEKFIAAEPATEWADEARGRVQMLAPLASFKELLAADYDRFARDPAAAHAFVRAHPQDTRRYGETKILGGWAEAVKAGKHDEAEKHLRIAREFGVELARFRGEGMVQAAVAAIENAGPDALRHLVEGHIHFRNGQKAFMADLAAEAQRTLTLAADELRRGGSPISLLAEYFVAYTYHVQGDVDEGRRRLEALIASAPASFPAHRGQLLWHLGMAQLARGEWGAAIETFGKSVAVFERLGEDDFAATVREIIAGVYDRVGNHSAAWSHRTIALREIGKRSTSRLQVAISSISRGAIARRDWPVALAFLGLEVGIADRIDDVLLSAEMLQLRARVHGQMGSHDAMAADLGRARTIAQRLKDPEIRHQSEIDTITVQGMFSESPAETVRLLTTALEDFRRRGRRTRLPDIHLSRGRAYAAMTDHIRAAADFEAGIAELESHRSSLQPGEDRWGVFDAGRELFDEAILLALSRRDHTAAFAYSERARARELLESIRANGAAGGHAEIPRGTTVVEYAPLRDRLLIFVARDGQVHVAEEQTDRDALRAEVKSLHDAVADGRSAFDAASATLHRRLITPIATSLTSAETIIFVPSAELASVPFSALRSANGHYLIEDHNVVVVPSATVFATLASAPQPAEHRERSLLVVGNPITATDDPQLPSSEQEARAVSAQYSRVTALMREQATPEAFVKHAPSADVIHVAGHAVAAAGPNTTASLLLTDGRLDAKTIAAMKLRRNALVVLAACGTARGDVRASEGTISVARAFLAAGARSVIATLWAIDDVEAAQFFTRVHEHLASGLVPSDALRATQLEWIRRPNGTPQMWAAVQADGN